MLGMYYTNPSQETLSLNPEICDLTEMANGQSTGFTLSPLPEMANLKRIYGILLAGDVRQTGGEVGDHYAQFAVPIPNLLPWPLLA